MKKIWLISLALIIGALIAVGYTYMLNRSQPIEPGESVGPSPTPPTAFRIISIHPKEKQPVAFANIAITITFSDELNVDSLIVNIRPNIDIRVDSHPTDKRIIYLKPNPRWVFNQEYRISLYAASVDGKTIKNYTFGFTPLPPVGETID